MKPIEYSKQIPKEEIILSFTDALNNITESGGLTSEWLNTYSDKISKLDSVQFLQQDGNYKLLDGFSAREERNDFVFSIQDGIMRLVTADSDELVVDLKERLSDYNDAKRLVVTSDLAVRFLEYLHTNHPQEAGDLPKIKKDAQMQRLKLWQRAVKKLVPDFDVQLDTENKKVIVKLPKDFDPDQLQVA